MIWVLLTESCQYLEVILCPKVVTFTLTANSVPYQTVCALLNFYNICTTCTLSETPN